MQAFKALLLIAILMIAGTAGAFLYFNYASGSTTNPQPTPTPGPWATPTPPTPIPTAIPPYPTPTPTTIPVSTPTPSPLPNGITGTVEITLKITWGNGITTTVSQTQTNLTPSMPLFTVLYQNQEIQTATAIVKVTLTGQSTTWSSTVTQQIELYKSPAPIPKTSSTGTYANSGSSFLSGTAFEVSNLALSESQIDPVMQIYGAGDYTMQFNAKCDITVGATSLTGIIPSCLLYYTYQNGVAQYSVIMSPVTI